MLIVLGKADLICVDIYSANSGIRLQLFTGDHIMYCQILNSLNQKHMHARLQCDVPVCKLQNKTKREHVSCGAGKWILVFTESNELMLPNWNKCFLHTLNANGSN